MEMYVIALILLFTSFTVFAWRDFRSALFALPLLLPTYLLRFSIGPIPFTVLEAFILILAGVWITRENGLHFNLRALNPYIRPIFLLIAAACFGVVVANDTFGALNIWKSYFVEPFLVFLMIHSAATSKNDQKHLFQSLAVSTIILSLIAVLQYATGYGIPAPWDIERRVTSLFQYPNALGLFLAPIAGASAVLALKESKKWLWITTLILSMAAIVLAKTEAALVAIPAALVVTLIISDARKTTKARVLFELFVVTLIAVTLIPNVADKLFLQDYSGQVRLSQWAETRAFLRDHPVFGAGLNGYPDAIQPYHDPRFYEIFQYPHNLFLNIWVELGLIGLVAFFWLAWLVLKSTQTNKNNALVLASFAALTTMVIHGFVDVPFFKNDLSVMTAILLAVISANKK